MKNTIRITNAPLNYDMRGKKIKPVAILSYHQSFDFDAIS